MHIGMVLRELRASRRALLAKIGKAATTHRDDLAKRFPRISFQLGRVPIALGQLQRVTLPAADMRAETAPACAVAPIELNENEPAVAVAGSG